MPKSAHLNVRALISPNSLVIVGASKEGSYGGRFLFNLRASEYAGKIYLVNPKYDQIEGMPCYPSIDELPCSADLVVIIVPYQAVLGVLEQSVRKGIKSAIVISAGFAESGHEGGVIQKAIRQLSDQHGLPICGPNCLGIANCIDHIMLHAYRPVHPWPGEIGLVSQSGALAFASILPKSLDRGLSFSYVISSGNEAVLETIDYMEFFLADPYTRVISCFLEGFKDGRRFLTLADNAIRAGKPIIICKVGRSALGSRQALSHTGSMTGSDQVYQTVFDQKGVIRVTDPEDLFEKASIFSRCTEPRGEGLAILSTSGGVASLLADQCGLHGLDLPPLAEKTTKSLSGKKYFLALGKLMNPLDIRGSGAAYLPEILLPFIEDDRYHLLIVALGMPAVGEHSAKVAEDLIRSASMTDKALIVLWIGTRIDGEGNFSGKDGFRLLERSNVPVFYNINKCIQAVSAFIHYHRFRKCWSTTHQ